MWDLPTYNSLLLGWSCGIFLYFINFFLEMLAKASLYGCLRERLVAWWEDIELL